MKLHKLIVENFRGYSKRTVVDFGNLTAIVGRNDVGKSTLLEALCIFLDGDGVKIDGQDACVHRPGDPITISCIFDEFPEELILDAKAPTTLQAEHLLNKDGLLELIKVFDTSTKTLKTRIYARAIHPSADHVHDLLGLKQAALKARIAELAIPSAEVRDARYNSSLREAVRNGVGDLLLTERLVPLEVEDGKRVWEELQNALPTFALFKSDRSSRDDDDEVQDPMRLAVKQAIGEMADQLESIKAEVIRRASEVAGRTIDKLREMDPDLAADLKPEVRAEPKWDSFKLTLVGDDGIPVNKRGSGVRRLILLNFFRAEAERRHREATKRSIIYAIEEPETSQHPSNQAMLIKALMELGASENTQVILTTHVPGIASMLPTDAIRFVRRGSDRHPEVHETLDTVFQQVADELGIWADKRAKVLVYVEGPHDVKFMQQIAAIYRASGQEVPDLTSDPSIAWVVTGGGNLTHWVNKRYLASLDLPEVHIYDRDTEMPPKYKRYVDAVLARNDGSWACLTSKREMENYLHPDAIKAAFGFDVVYTDQCDVPGLVAEMVHAISETTVAWSEVNEKKRSQKQSRAKTKLNEEAVARMTVAMLLERDPDREILGWLRQIASRIQPVRGNLG